VVDLLGSAPTVGAVGVHLLSRAQRSIRDAGFPVAGPVWQNRVIGHHGVATRKPITRAALAVALSLLAAAATAPAAAASEPATPDTVTLLGGPEPGVSVPADGRLNDFELTGRVLGVATGTRDARGPAARGQRFWVFGLDWTTDPAGKNGTVGVTATVNAGTTQVSLPLPARADRPGGGPSGPMWFRASLPAAPTTTVTVTAGQYAQTFDLTTMTRQAPTPAALYRTAGSWETTQAVGVTDQIPTPDPGVELAPRLATAALPVHLHTVTLSWFAPDTPTDIPTNPAQAWLTVDISSQVENVGLGSDAYLDYQTPITATGLTLTIPGQPPIPATIYPGGGTDTTGVGIFPDRYAFEVPATLTTATLTVTPGNLLVHGSADSFNPPTTITAQGDAAFPITLPPITTPPVTTPPGGAARAPGSLHAPAPASHRSAAGPSATVTSATTGGHGGLVAGLVGVLVLIGLAGTAVIVCRHRRTPALTPAAPTAGRSAGTERPPAPTAWAHPRPAPPAPPPEPTPTPATSTWARPTWAEPPAPDDHDRETLSSPTGPAPQAEKGAGATTSAAPRPGPAAGTGSPPPLSTLSVRVLGPVEIDGWLEPPRRTAVRDIVTYLACHDDRPVSTDRLRDALARKTPTPGTRPSPARSPSEPVPITETTLRTYMTAVRNAVGPDRLPDATGAGGYRLTGVDCDWTRFQDLTVRAGTAATETAATETAATETERIRLLTEAVALIRGRPFADGCAWAERDGLPGFIEDDLMTATRTLATIQLRAGDPTAAVATAGVGLNLQPHDETLALTGLDAAHAAGRLTSFYQNLAGRLEANGQDVPPAVTNRYQQLRRRDRPGG
jgi:hypothetical protein